MLDISEISTVRRPLKAVATLLLGPYRFNRIYRLAAIELEPKMPQGMSVERLEDLPSASVNSVELRERFGYSYSPGPAPPSLPTNLIGLLRLSLGSQEQLERLGLYRVL